MTLEDLIVEGVETAGPGTTAEALAMRMEEAGVGSIVIEEGMNPLGVVTDRDVAVRVAARDRPASEITAEEIMTEHPVTMHESDGLLDVTRAMADHAVRRMPIVDDEGRLVGIVTLDDVIVLLATELSNLGDVVQAESPPY